MFIHQKQAQLGWTVEHMAWWQCQGTKGAALYMPDEGTLDENNCTYQKKKKKMRIIVGR